MKKIDLTGKWDVVSSCGTYKWEGEVPGSVLFDLEKQGLLGQEGAFFRDNNRKAPELMNRDYTYKKVFQISDEFLKGGNTGESRYMIEAEGIDTLAEITINGIFVAATNNMHRSYSFNIGSLLHSGENIVEITLKNSLKYIKKEHNRRPLISEDDEGVTTIPGFYSIRKSHCSYGWDWGPQVPDAGIWKPIGIIKYDCGQFSDLRITQEHTENQVILDISGETELWSDRKFEVTGTITSPEGEIIPFSFLPQEKALVSLEKPMLWWPNGMGEQSLYTIQAALLADGISLGTIEKNIGLRTLTIVRNPDQWGESFNFEVNGIPLFARGANYIPEDIYLNRMSVDRTENLLNDCQTANFNCIRVWGGGVFPHDYFYDTCDKLGLIVWQDLMFACAIYDMQSGEFTKNIEEEIRDNLRRIRHHASLGLICGNNEMEWFFTDYDTFPQTKENEFEYIKQYHMVIPAIHEEVCPEIFYWSSSPSSGGYFVEPNSPDKGDCHFWAVWHGNKDFSEYKKHYFRFMSEFGFESLPSMKTIESFTEEADRNVFSPVMEEHQKRVGGNPKIVSYLSKYFRYPKDLDSLAYVSQLSQSDAIRLGVEHWRRNRGRCMGSIYWQLNDNWPVASWSSIDYYGRWKALHYSVKKAYDNILLSFDGEGQDAWVHLSNESGDEVSGSLFVKLFSFDGKLIFEKNQDVKMAPWTSGEVYQFTLNDDIQPGSCVLSAMFISHQGVAYEGAHFFEIYKYLELESPVIEFSVKQKSKRIFELILNCDKPALFTEIHTPEGDPRFSDNYFHLFPGVEKCVTAEFDGEMKESEVSFMIRSLTDSF